MNYTGKGTNDSGTHEIIVIINCVLNAPLMLISIVGNSLVLAAILRTPSIRSTSMIILCSLAVSDLLVGFVAQPLYIADELQSLITQDDLSYRLSAIIGFFVCGVSLGTITAISVDRFLALHYHMRYAILVTKARVKCILALIWLIMFLGLGFYFWDKFAYHLMAGSFTAICLVVCTFSYIKIYRIVRQHQLQIQAQQQAVEILNIGINTNMARLKNSAISTFVFYICMVICFFPHVVILTVFGTLYKDWKTEWAFATTLLFMNSSINPILYCWRLRELRTAVLRTIRQLLFKELNGNCQIRRKQARIVKIGM